MSFHFLRILALLLLLPLKNLHAQEMEDSGANPVPPLPQQILPNNSQIHYSGRFDLSQPGVAKCSWPATAITLRFKATAINAKLGLGENRFTVVLDNQPLKRLTGKIGDSKTDPETRVYALATGLTPSEHTVTLFKNTETNVGDATFAGFQLPAGAETLSPSVFKRKIEVIGDSISAGFGIEGADQNERFMPSTENAYLTYGALTARALQAEYSCIAWSGRTLWPTFTIPEIYNRTLPRGPEPIWPGDAQLPDVYVINLSTNDFSRPENPAEEAWVKAYRDFIATLRAKSPDATIYCAQGPMLSDTWPRERKVRSTARAYIERVVRESNAAGDSKVHFIEFELQDIPKNGAGSAYHPNVKTNQIMAAKLTAAIQADLGW
jgi:lysophospholipase L1-like esterase